MKKSDIALLAYRVDCLENVAANSMTNLAEIVSSSFSAIATADPKVALSILDQLNEQREEIENLVKEREDREERYVAVAVQGIPDFIDFED